MGDGADGMADSRAETFRAAAKAAMREDYGGQRGFAEATGHSEGRISHIVTGRGEPTAETLEFVLENLRTEALRRRVHRAWVAEFAPLPEIPGGLPAAEVVRQCERLVAGGLVHRAVEIGRRGMEDAGDPADYHAIAARVVPWLLRLGRVSEAFRTREEVERRARSQNDQLRVLEALAMRGNALHSIDAATPKAVRAAHEAAMAHAESWRPADSVARRIRQYRVASLWREYALHVLLLHRRRQVDDSALGLASNAAELALRVEGPDYLRATGLEVRSRVQAARGELAQAEETLEELGSFGLDKGFELAEKTDLTRARIAEADGDLDEAVAILEGLRDRCLSAENLHHFRRADQELARILAGL